MEVKHKKGTTTVGIVTKDAVILAADNRVSLGNINIHSKTKINKISKYIGLTEAGAVSDAQMLSKYLKAEMQLYRLDENLEPDVNVGASLLASILYQGKGYFPYYVGMIMGGVDKEGKFKLYNMGGDGSSISDTYTSVGSGMQIALGVLQSNFKEGMSLEEGINLAVKAVNTAMKRDIFSGNGIDVAIIDADGYRMLSESKVATAMKK